MAAQSKLWDGMSSLTHLLNNNKVMTSGAIIAIVIHNLIVFGRIRRANRQNRMDPDGKAIQIPKSSYSSDSVLNGLSYEFPSSYKSGKVGVNGSFFNQIKAIFKVILPNGFKLNDKIILILMLHTSFLLLRTYLSVIVARIDGRIVKDLVNRDHRQFLRSIGYWFAVAVPATYTNSVIKYLQSKLAIAFRTKLMDYAHHLYLNKDQSYYKLLHLDREVVGADQYLTSDIHRFSEALAGLYSSLGKPTLDMVIFTYQLNKSIGPSSIFIIMISYLITVTSLRTLSPNFGRMAATKTQLEGSFRNAHNRLITNAEEIAFYHGEKVEEGILNQTYSSLIKHINTILKARIPYNLGEDFVIKYCWSAIGLCMCAIPVFKPQWLDPLQRATVKLTSSSGGTQVKNTAANRTQDFITNKRLMMSLGDAGGRIMYAGKELAELAGYTFRVYTLFSTLNRLRHNNFTVTINEPSSTQLEVTQTESDPKLEELPKYCLEDINGFKVIGSDFIKFDKVPIVAPNPGNPNGGEVLVKDLTFKIEFGQHLLINGPNGVGKSAVARVLRGLWPVFAGTVEVPEPEQLFFIPQKPYLSLGNLRDQIIYPHTKADMTRLGLTDADLDPILNAVHLTAIPTREGGLDTIKEWKDVFSGGEKQRINLARLFYHKPKFAVLDECTSAVSSDVEGLMYSYAKELGITLLTISHRPALLKYHNYLLSLKGEEGKFEIRTLAGKEDVQQTVKKEISELREKLINVQQWKVRLDEVKKALEV